MPNNTTYTKELDKLLNQTIEAIPMPGLSVAVTNQTETVYSMQYGHDVDRHSTFILGSTSKSFTATAICYLLDNYGIKMEEHICNYLPLIKTEITILDLLNHTSGISTYEKINNLKYLGQYGTFEYSNANYNLLGELIEVVTGDTFPNYINKSIFTVLNMRNSFALSEDTINRTIQGYKSYFGFFIPYNEKVPDNSTWIQSPSGYLCSSTSDMEKYLRLMLEYSHNNLTLLQFIKSTGVEVSSNPAIEGIYDNYGIYGMGWIYKNVNGIDILYHTGKVSSFSSISVLIPQMGIGISAMCNMGDFLVGTNLIEKLYEEIISVVIGKNDVSIISKYDYWKQHSAINLVLLILLMLSLLPIILLCTLKMPFHLTVFNVVRLLLIHIIIPVLLIALLPIIRIPYSVAVDFTPDILFVILFSALSLFLTGIWILFSQIFTRI